MAWRQINQDLCQVSWGVKVATNGRRQFAFIFKKDPEVFLFLACWIAAGAVALSQQIPDNYVRAARWIDPVSGEVRGPSVFEISGGVITRAIPAEDFERKPAGQVTDLGTKATVLPGLIDAHVHLTIGGASESNAAAALKAGFTTVVDLGATTDEVMRLRDRINTGAVQGPRILAAGLWAGRKNGICEFGGIGIADGAEGFRDRVRENVKAGADVIKVCVSTWLIDAFQKPDAYDIDDASLAAAVDESRRARRLVIAHAISLGSVRASLGAGVNGLAHAAFVDRSTAEEMRKLDVFLIPTLASLVAERTGPVAVALRQSVATAARAGVRIVFGTDGGVLPHGQNAREFQALVAAGLKPIEVIRAATINARTRCPSARPEAWSLGRRRISSPLTAIL